MDPLTPAERSARMSAVRHRDTQPEMRVRRTLHGMGYRYRLHRKDLPGKPDIAFTARRKVIFVHGCFWHRHDNCKLARLPKSRLDFWVPKLDRNRSRDNETRATLTAMGWEVLVIWECQVRDVAALTSTLREFLDPPRS